MADKPNECVYCGGRPLSREHVIPKWLFKTPQVRKLTKDHPYSPQPHVVFSHTIDFARKVASIQPDLRGISPRLNDVVVRAVCSPCNKGWMSGLETAARPILMKFLEGENVRLGYGDSLALARWAVKTAMMYEFNHLETVAFSSAQRSHLYDNRDCIPPYVGVFLAPFEDTKAFRLGHTGGAIFDSYTREYCGTIGATAIVVGTACIIVASVSDPSLLAILEARLRLEPLTWKAVHIGEPQELTHHARPSFAAPVTHRDIDGLLTLV